MSDPAAVLHDPTSETTSEIRPRRTPPADLAGKVVALQGIGKARSSEFLDHIEDRLNRRGIETIRTEKATNARTAPIDILQRIATEAHAVVQALAD
ncbi:MAG: hypothetical protein OEU54_13675 [Gemmatimonadota bacterium]|nr:hypothetical protein [Gemmatimonadota bacterium]